jgi:hypothetical protein
MSMRFAPSRTLGTVLAAGMLAALTARATAHHVRITATTVLYDKGTFTGQHK